MGIHKWKNCLQYELGPLSISLMWYGIPTRIFSRVFLWKSEKMYNTVYWKNLVNTWSNTSIQIIIHMHDNCDRISVGFWRNAHKSGPDVLYYPYDSKKVTVKDMNYSVSNAKFVLWLFGLVQRVGLCCRGLFPPKCCWLQVPSK